MLEIPLAIWAFGVSYYLPFRVKSSSSGRDDDVANQGGLVEVEGRDQDGLVVGGDGDPLASSSGARRTQKSILSDAKARLSQSHPPNSNSKSGTESEVRPYAALHLFDAVVVLATFVLEVVLRGRERELAGLLVLLRLWRLVKLVGGASLFPLSLFPTPLSLLRRSSRRGCRFSFN